MSARQYARERARASAANLLAQQERAPAELVNAALTLIRPWCWAITFKRVEAGA